MKTKGRKKSRDYYVRKFGHYPDVVDLSILREMLGGISESFVRKQLQAGVIKSFRIDRKVYMIPKEYVIDYAMSDAYQGYKHRLKAQI